MATLAIHKIKWAKIIQRLNRNFNIELQAYEPSSFSCYLGKSGNAASLLGNQVRRTSSRLVYIKR